MFHCSIGGEEKKENLFKTTISLEGIVHKVAMAGGRAGDVSHPRWITTCVHISEWDKGYRCW